MADTLGSVKRELITRINRLRNFLSPLGDAPITGTPSATTFLRGDLTWASPTASVADGDKGDIVVSGGGTAWAFDSAVVTAAGRALIDDANAAAQRTTLGVGVTTVAFSVAGAPTIGLVVPFTSNYAYTYAANLAGSRTRCVVAPTALATFTLAINGAAVGNITIAAGVFVGTMPIVAGGAVAAGDIVTLTCPSPADATLATVSFSLALTRV